MKRILRRGLPIVLLGALIAAGVLLVTRPWSTDTLVQEAEAGTMTIRVCDTVLEVPPGSVDYKVRVTDGIDQGEPFIWLERRGSNVAVDALNPAAVRAALGRHGPDMDAILRTVRTEPLDPATAPWPYNEDSQLSSEPRSQGAFRHRVPDPASGIQTSVIYASGHLMHAHVLVVENCRSKMEIEVRFPSDAPDGAPVITKDIHPDDEAAFQTLLDTVQVGGLEY